MMTAELWNRIAPVGTPVEVRRDDGTFMHTLTASKAWALGNGQLVVKLDGLAGGYALERVYLLPSGDSGS